MVDLEEREKPLIAILGGSSFEGDIVFVGMERGGGLGEVAGLF